MAADPCSASLLEQIAAGDYSLAAWVSVVRVYHKLVRRLERMLIGHGLCLAHFELLVKLSMAEGTTQQDLAAKLLVTKGNVCALVDRMESSGWVERRAHPEDRRANRLFLTDAGKGLMAKALPEHLQLIREGMSVLGKGRQKAMYESLTSIDEAIGED